MSYTILLGVIGGVVISLLLIYPLYFHLPIILIPNWNETSTEVSVLSVIVSLAVLVVVGMFTARYGNAQSSLQRMAYGALGGLVSSTIGYGILVGPASGVWGLFRAFPSGIHRAPDNATYVAMVANAVISIGFWSAITLWGYIGLGALLGGAGGLLTRSKWSSTEPSIAQQIAALSAVGIPIASANCMQAIHIFSLLYEVVRKAVSVHQFSLQIWISTNAPVVSAFIWLLGWQIVTWRAFVHIRAQATVCRISWLLSGMFGILFPLVQVFTVLFFAYHQYLSFCLLSLLIGFLSGYDVWKIKSLPKKFEYPSPRSVFAYIAQAGLVILLTPICGGINLSQNYVTLVIPLLVPIQPSPAETASTAIPLTSVTELVNGNYLSSVRTIAGWIFDWIWCAFVVTIIYHNAVKYVKTFGHIRKIALKESEEEEQ